MLNTLGLWIIPLAAALGALIGWLYSRATTPRAATQDGPASSPKPPVVAPDAPISDDALALPPNPTPEPEAEAEAEATADPEPTLEEPLSPSRIPHRPQVPPRPSTQAPILDWVTHAETLDSDGFASEAREIMAVALDRCATAVSSNRRPEAGDALTRALEVATKMADQGALGRAHALLGRLSERMEDKDGAHEHYLTALELYENLNDRRGIGATCELLARLHAHLNDPEGAEAYWRYGLSLATALGDRKEEARILGILGRLATLNGDLETAEDLFREAMTLEEALGHPLEEGFLTVELARLERTRGNEDTAILLFDAALARLEEAGAASEELDRLRGERDGED
ncbi:tetratricopeptide repeat protein [Rhodospirillum sp. A1_3_36]|uniref:tetratricopeptide repeat protein n=1 Tax=Rhodospirillum sp. A1_3_36 TaxID=3391666 RepID=UPI0039A7748E